MSETGQHELSVTRLIAAPPETVYRVYTERTTEWWAPRPWKTPVIENDLRPGGRAYCEMESPEGERFGHEGVFLEIVPNRKIVSTSAFKADWMPQVASGEGCDMAMLAIFTFDPEAGGTRYTARVRHWSEEAAKAHEAMGFEEGWGICAAQLAELAEAEAANARAAV